MRLLRLILSAALGFCTVIGFATVLFGMSMTGGFGRDDIALLKEGVGKAYVSGLKGVEQAAKRLRGDYCDAEQDPVRDAHCG